MMESAAVLAQLREKAGMPGYQVISRHSGGKVSKSSVQNLIQGIANPRHETVIAFVKGCLSYAQKQKWSGGLEVRERTESYWLELYRAAAGVQHTQADVRIEPNLSYFRLPAHATQFVGRTEVVRELLGLMVTHDHAGRAVAIHAIDGMAGVGKTELALHVGNKVADRFPDGAIFLDLAGYSPGLEPIPPTQALLLLLKQRGVDTDETKHDEATLRMLWRNECARHRLLIVLDNARDKDQVEPLLPNVVGCLVLITSRRKLIGLPGVIPFELDVFTSDEAKELLLSSAQVATPVDTTAVQRVVEICGRLPLAIMIAASMLTHRPGYTIAELANDLDAERRHLEDLEDDDGSLHIAVHTSIRLSYQHLSTDLKKAFRLCGWHPGPEVTEPALAAMFNARRDNDECPVRVTGRDVTFSRRMLLGLADRNLIRKQVADGSRYRMHDLVRASARLSRTEASEDERTHALGHLTRAYRATLEHAESWRVGGRNVQPLNPNDMPLCTFVDLSSADQWVALERENLLALVDSIDHHSAFISQLLGPKLRDLGFLDDARHCYEDAEKGYNHMGIEAFHAHAIRGLAGIEAFLGDHASARRNYQRAKSISRRIKDDIGQALAFRGLGQVARMTDDYAGASGYLIKAIEMLAEALERHKGNPIAVRDYAVALAELGQVEKARENLGTALAILHKARQAYITVGDSASHHKLLSTFAEIERDLGNFEAARKYIDEALARSRSARDSDSEAEALWQLGQLEKEVGNPSVAVALFERVIELRAASKESYLYARDLLGLADAERLDGRLDESRTHFEEMLSLCHGFQDRDGIAQAHLGLGDVAAANRDTKAAKGHWQHALNISEEIGLGFIIRKANFRLTSRDN